MMTMRKLALISLSITFFSIPSLRADDFTNNFKDNINQKSLDALAQDLGVIMGGSSFHHGKALGFPLGFDVGAHAVVTNVDKDNLILKDDGNRTQGVWGQVELGLPLKINLIGRMGQMEEADMVGGGLRYGLLKPSLPGLPALSVMGLFSKMDHDYFKLQTWTGNAVLSIDFPFIDPYLGVGYDFSTLELKDAAFVGVSPSVSRNLEGEASGYRAELGINLHLIPFTYINVGIGLANGESMYHAGAGVRL
ncbi:MAG: hypothetical protein LHV69_06635 [Elusimicrobia bacterium]|nr:hypothetical protein [Candidatus Obscuribacterium magneticum]